MANIIENNGNWGPISEGANTGGFPVVSYEGKQVVIDFDDTENTSILYTGLIEAPISTETEFIWNTEAVDCENDADVTISWQGTDDPSVARLSHAGQDVAASDTGWTTVEVMDLNGSSKCDSRTAVNLAGVTNVVNKDYVRLKFITTVNNPGDVDITCRLINLPAIGKITHSVAL
jgi:hypothetical protein